MEPLGWLIFIVSNITVIVLVVFCFYKVFSINQEHMHAPLDIDTKDLAETNTEEEDEDYSILENNTK